MYSPCTHSGDFRHCDEEIVKCFLVHTLPSVLTWSSLRLTTVPMYYQPSAFSYTCVNLSFSCSCTADFSLFPSGGQKVLYWVMSIKILQWWLRVTAVESEGEVTCHMCSVVSRVTWWWDRPFPHLGFFHTRHVSFIVFVFHY